MTSINATINIKHDTLESAFIKKSNNSSLSLKSLKKLASIANTTFGLSKADAKKLFLNGQCIGKSDVSTRLAKQLTDVIAKVSNDDLKKHISNFIHNCGYIDERNIPKKKACAPQKETHPTQLRINTLYAERLRQHCLSLDAFCKKNMPKTELALKTEIKNSGMKKPTTEQFKLMRKEDKEWASAREIIQSQIKAINLKYMHLTGMALVLNEKEEPMKVIIGHLKPPALPPRNSPDARSPASFPNEEPIYKTLND